MADRAPQSMVEALQAAVINRLKGNAAVKALVGARIYDEVPSDKDKPGTPYLYLGPIALRRPAETSNCSKAREAKFRLFAVSTEFGRLEAWAVIDAVIDALDNSELQLTAPYSTIGDVVKLINAGDVVAPITPKSAFADFTDTLTILGD
jgi:hypothetical protein